MKKLQNQMQKLGILLIVLAGSIDIIPARTMAADAAALVMEVAGEIQPTLNPMDEIAPGTTITLTKESSVRFFHYRSCKVATVKGGELNIRALGYDVSKEGTLVGEEDRNCPIRVRLVASKAGEHVTGGLVLRGDTEDQLIGLSSSPSFLLLGPGARNVMFARFTLKKGDGNGPAPKFDLEAKGFRMQWQDGAPTLAEGEKYSLCLLNASGESLGCATTIVNSPQSSSDDDFRVLHIE